MSPEMELLKEVVEIAKGAGNLGPWFILFGGGLLVYFKVLKTGKIVVVPNNGNGKAANNGIGGKREADPHAVQVALCESRFRHIEERLDQGDSTFKEYGKKINATHSIAVRLLERSRHWEQPGGGGKMKRLLVFGLLVGLLLVAGCIYKPTVLYQECSAGADKPMKAEITTNNPVEVKGNRAEAQGVPQ